jgi:hypothetical protein
LKRSWISSHRFALLDEKVSVSIRTGSIAVNSEQFWERTLSMFDIFAGSLVVPALKQLTTIAKIFLNKSTTLYTAVCVKNSHFLSMF